MTLELAIQERNLQLSEFQTMIDTLKQHNSSLEKEKEEEIERYSDFRQETLEEAQHLRDIHNRLQEKEKELDELLRKNTKDDSSEEAAEESNGDDSGMDWFEECVKVSKRVKELQDLLDRQDDLFKDMEKERELFKEEIKKLREATMKHVDDGPGALKGVPELLKDIQNVVDKLRKKDNRTKNTPKPIRFYSDTDLAVKELQGMKKAKTNAVFIVADAFATSDKEFAYKRFSKKMKKKVRRKMKMLNLLESNATLRETAGIQEESKHQSGQQEEVVETRLLQSASEPTESTPIDCANEEHLVHGEEFIAAEETGKLPSESLQEGDNTEEEAQLPLEQVVAETAETVDCNVMDFSLVTQEECTFGGFAYSPVLSKSIKEMRGLDVDKLRGALEFGRAVNTKGIQSVRHTSLLMSHRQKLAPLYEFEEAGGVSRGGRQSYEVMKLLIIRIRLRERWNYLADGGKGWMNERSDGAGAGPAIYKGERRA